MEAPVIRRLGVEHAALLVPLRREALESAPLAFGASPADDASLSVEHLRASLANEANEAFLGSLAGERLVAMAVLRREPGSKRAHRAGIFGVYVTPEARGRGVGRALLDAAVAVGRSWGDVVQLEISVSNAAAGAKRIYEAAGFREWGCLPRALRHGGRELDMYKLVLHLDQGPLAPNGA